MKLLRTLSSLFLMKKEKKNRIFGAVPTHFSLISTI